MHPDHIWRVFRLDEENSTSLAEAPGAPCSGQVWIEQEAIESDSLGPRPGELREGTFMVMQVPDQHSFTIVKFIKVVAEVETTFHEVDLGAEEAAQVA